jgi:ABC-type Fe3+-siderophore transport system permease subunit
VGQRSLITLLFALAIVSLTHGAATVAAARVFEILFWPSSIGGDIGRDALVILNIRLPRSERRWAAQVR